MNVFEDYINYMNDHSELIEKLYSTSSQVLLCFDDVIKVCDHIYQMSTKEAVSKEHTEIFEIGFGYLANIITDLEMFYNDYLNKDIIEFNQYASLILYLFLIDDFKQYLVSNDEYKGSKKTKIDAMLKEIEEAIQNKNPLDEMKENAYLITLESVGYYRDFNPTYTVFAQIDEELKN